MVSGETAVVIFFVLSGLVLFRSLSADRAPPAQLALSFTIRRVFRIYPALLVCLVVCSIAFWFVGLNEMSLQRFAENALLIAFGVNGATWTLAVEFVMVPFLLLSALAYRRWKLWGLIAAIAAVWLLTRVKWPTASSDLARAFWPAFAFGMLIATPVGERLAKMLPLFVLPFAFVAMLVARHTISGYLTGMLVLSSAAALVVHFVYYNKGGAFSRFLNQPISQFLGRISYSFYLFNVLFLEIIVHLLRELVPFASSHPLEVGLLASICVIALSIPAAYLSTRYVEEPLVRVGRAVAAKTIEVQMRTGLAKA